MTNIRIKDLTTATPTGTEDLPFDSAAGTKNNTITNVVDIGNKTITNPVIGTNTVGNQTTVRTRLTTSGSFVALRDATFGTYVIPQNDNDVNFFVSGAIAGKDNGATRTIAEFGGDLVVSGNIIRESQEIIDYFDDFVDVSSTSTNGWTISTSNSGSIALAGSAAISGFPSVGVIAPQVTTDNGSKALMYKNGLGLTMSASQAIQFQYRFTDALNKSTLAAADNECTFALGAAGSFGNNGPADEVAFFAGVVSGSRVWYMLTYKSSSLVAQDGPYPITSASWHNLRLTLSESYSKIEMSAQDGPFVTLGTSSIAPTKTSYSPFIAIFKDTNAGNRTFLVDSIKARGRRSSLDALTSSQGSTFTAVSTLTLGTGIVEISDSTNSGGSSTTEAAKIDHVHAHGNRGGGNLHTAVTTASNGFMSAQDKSTLDSINNSTSSYATTAYADAVGANAIATSEVYALAQDGILSGAIVSDLNTKGFFWKSTTADTIFTTGSIQMSGSAQVKGSLFVTGSVHAPTIGNVSENLIITGFGLTFTDGGNGTLFNQAVDFQQHQLNGVSNPTTTTDAANKQYVDYPGFRVVTGATDTLLTTDFGKVVCYSATGSVTTNLNNSLTASFPSSVGMAIILMQFENSASAPFISMSGGATLNGSTTVYTASVGPQLISITSRNGLNWFR